SSRSFSVQWVGRLDHVQLLFGSIHWWRQFPAAPMGLRFSSWRAGDRPGDIAFGTKWPWYEKRPPGFYLILPLWLPVLLVTIPTVFLWRRDRGRPPSGHCPKCGYNLTGNESGFCSECGTAVAKRRESNRNETAAGLGSIRGGEHLASS